MKTFIVWLIAHVAVFATAGFGIHSYLAAHPVRTLIAVDTSYDMAKQRISAMNAVEDMGDSPRYQQFAVITDKEHVHSWQDKPELGSILTYGPRQLAVLNDEKTYPEIAQADKRVLITNEVGDIPGFSGWQIVRP